MSIRYRSDTKVLERYLLNMDLMAFAIWIAVSRGDKIDQTADWLVKLDGITTYEVSLWWPSSVK